MLPSPLSLCVVNDGALFPFLDKMVLSVKHLITIQIFLKQVSPPTRPGEGSLTQQGELGPVSLAARPHAAD